MVKQKEQKKDLKFEKRNKRFVDSMSKDPIVKKLSDKWLIACHKYEYSYHFTWLGLPIIQYPQDIVAIQEIIWKVKPDLVIETGIARGGSLLLSASILELIGHGTVLGIDMDIRKLNKRNIKKNHLIKRISMIEGPATDKKIVSQVKKFAKGKKRILLFLDSAHTFEHVLEELNSYSLKMKFQLSLSFQMVGTSPPISSQRFLGNCISFSLGNINLYIKGLCIAICIPQ